jgi:hypothetical protein
METATLVPATFHRPVLKASALIFTVSRAR